MTDINEAAVADLAVEYWKLHRAFERAISHLDESRAHRAAAQARFAAGKLEAVLSGIGLRIVVFDSQIIGPTIPVQAINSDELGAIIDPIVVETIDPAVLAGDRVVRMGRVVGGASNVSGN